MSTYLLSVYRLEHIRSAQFIYTKYNSSGGDHSGFFLISCFNIV